MDATFLSVSTPTFFAAVRTLLRQLLIEFDNYLQFFNHFWRFLNLLVTASVVKCFKKLIIKCFYIKSIFMRPELIIWTKSNGRNFSVCKYTEVNTVVRIRVHVKTSYRTTIGIVYIGIYYMQNSQRHGDPVSLWKPSLTVTVRIQLTVTEVHPA